MAPHGPGMSNATHSHDPEFPDDDWNLYSMLDPALTTALNATRPTDAIGVFRPFARRLETNPLLVSDADEELMLVARFTSPVHIRKIMVIGGGSSAAHHPAVLKCYVNHENLDFTSIEATRCEQEFNLQVNSAGTAELIAAIHPFTNVSVLTMYFPRNHGQADNTIVGYIGLQGEHTHYRREAVHTEYEVLCSGQDIVQPEDAVGGHAGHLH